MTTIEICYFRSSRRVYSYLDDNWVNVRKNRCSKQCCGRDDGGSHFSTLHLSCRCVEQILDNQWSEISQSQRKGVSGGRLNKSKSVGGCAVLDLY